MLKPASIPTTYKSIRFRSRLEAKWACVFDQLGWEWEYESIDLAGWIPDFTITNARGPKPLLVEVKPDLVLDQAVVSKIIKACPGAGIPEDDSGTCSDAPVDVLILARHPFIYDTEWRTSIGWINDVCSNSGCSDFSHAFFTPGTFPNEWPKGTAGVWAGETGIWFDRFHAFHEKGRGFLSEEQIRKIWAQACNETQWRAPK